MRKPIATEMNGPTLEPDVAASMFERDPASVWVTLTEIMRAFGLSERELRLELTSGALTAHGRPSADGSGDWNGVAVRGDNLLKWAAITGHRVR